MPSDDHGPPGLHDPVGTLAVRTPPAGRSPGSAPSGPGTGPTRAAPGPANAARARRPAGPNPGVAQPAPAEPRHPTLVLAHGFTQTGACWGELGALLEVERPVLRVDLPGHGGSADVRADLPAAARLLVDAMANAASGDGAREPATGEATAGTGTAAADAPGGTGTNAGPGNAAAPVDLLGYSLGARVALQAALDHPERVGRLVLISGTAGIADPDARRARRARDEELADGLERSGDLEGFLRRWLASPMFAGLTETQAGWSARLENTPAGLASSLRLAGTGAQEPLWDRVGELRPPVLAIAGATDPRFVAHALALAAAAPAATATVMPGAGHAVHLHQPVLTARLVASWLSGTEPAPPA